MIELNSTETVETTEMKYSLLNSADTTTGGYWQKDMVAVFLLGTMAVALLGLLLLLAIPLAAFLFDTFGNTIPLFSQVSTWLGSGSRGLLFATILAGFILFTFLLLRFRLRRSEQLYPSAGCPHCHEMELIRVRRQRGDRAIDKFGIPARRYVCRNCSWGGLRLGGFSPRQYKMHAAMQAELLLANEGSGQQKEISGSDFA